MIISYLHDIRVGEARVSPGRTITEVLAADPPDDHAGLDTAGFVVRDERDEDEMALVPTLKLRVAGRPE